MRKNKAFIDIRTAGAILAVILFPHTGLCQGSIVTITFDGPPRQAAGTSRLVMSYSEAGGSLTAVPERPGELAFFELSGGAGLGWPENGTAYVLGVGWPVEFRFEQGFLFGLSSLDVAGLSDYSPAIDLSVVGFLAGGSTITNRAQGSGIGFRTIQFGAEWASGLEYVRISDYNAIDPTTGWSIDNLVVTIPEPSTGALTLLGAALLGLRLAKRRK